jgi:hypothetical protein
MTPGIIVIVIFALSAPIAVFAALKATQEAAKTKPGSVADEVD